MLEVIKSTDQLAVREIQKTKGIRGKKTRDRVLDDKKLIKQEKSVVAVENTIPLKRFQIYAGATNSTRSLNIATNLLDYKTEK